MPNEGPKDRILNQVGDSRRDFVKRVLIGAPFAAPVIASFAIGNLAVEPALARSAMGSPVPPGPACASGVGSYPIHALPDPGYVGPNQFRAHVTDTSGNTRVNGEVSIEVHGNHTAGIDIDMIKGALVTGAQLAINGFTVVPNIPLQGNPNINFSDTCGIPDFDFLLQAMANQQVTVSVQGLYNSLSFNAQGSVASTGNGVIELRP